MDTTKAMKAVLSLVGAAWLEDADALGNPGNCVTLG